jgi:hypothetical protein
LKQNKHKYIHPNHHKALCFFLALNLFLFWSLNSHTKFQIPRRTPKKCNRGEERKREKKTPVIEDTTSSITEAVLQKII